MSATPGQDVLSWRLPEVDVGRMKVLALLLADPNPIHFDGSAAHRSGIADVPVNQGPSTIAMIYNLFAASHPGRRVRKLSVRLLGSVLGGQEVVVTAKAAGGAGYEVEVLAGGDTPVVRGYAELTEQP